MESLIAFTTTARHIGFHNLNDFWQAWYHALLSALPVALVLISFISTVIKPRLEKFLAS